MDRNSNYKRDNVYSGLVRESDYDMSLRASAQKDLDEISLADTQRSRALIREERVNLVGESLPHYARIDHFSTDPY